MESPPPSVNIMTTCKHITTAIYTEKLTMQEKVHQRYTRYNILLGIIYKNIMTMTNKIQIHRLRWVSYRQYPEKY